MSTTVASDSPGGRRKTAFGAWLEQGLAAQDTRVTWKELAKRAGLSYSYLIQVKNGHEKPSPQAVRQLEQALGQPFKRNLTAEELAEAKRAAQLLMARADECFDNLDYASARNLYQRALDEALHVYGSEDLELADFYLGAGCIADALGDYALAREHCERSVVLRDQSKIGDQRDLAVALDRLATAEWHMGDYSAARTHFERALAISEEVFGSEHPTVASRLNNLGLVLIAQGDRPAARARLERVLAIDEKVLGPEHPDLAMPLYNFGSMLQDEGDLPAARSYYERALAIGEKALAPKHPDIAMWHNNLGLVLEAQGDRSSAGAHYEQALVIGEKTLGVDHPHTKIYRGNLSMLQQSTSGDVATSTVNTHEGPASAPIPARAINSPEVSFASIERRVREVLEPLDRPPFPYVSYNAFMALLIELQHRLPAPRDTAQVSAVLKAVLASEVFAPQLALHLRLALSSLKLIGDDLQAEPELVALVGALDPGTPPHAFAEALKPVVLATYVPLFLNRDNSTCPYPTIEKLEAEFEYFADPKSQDTIRKSATFFRRACDAAGLRLPPGLQLGRRQAHKATTKRPRRETDADSEKMTAERPRVIATPGEATQTLALALLQQISELDLSTLMKLPEGFRTRVSAPDGSTIEVIRTSDGLDFKQG